MKRRFSPAMVGVCVAALLSCLMLIQTLATSVGPSWAAQVIVGAIETLAIASAVRLVGELLLGFSILADRFERRLRKSLVQSFGTLDFLARCTPVRLREIRAAVDLALAGSETQLPRTSEEGATHIRLEEGGSNASAAQKKARRAPNRRAKTSARQPGPPPAQERRRSRAVTGARCRRDGRTRER
jgi:hypothetical protein